MQPRPSAETVRRGPRCRFGIGCVRGSLNAKNWTPFCQGSILDIDRARSPTYPRSATANRRTTSPGNSAFAFWP